MPLIVNKPTETSRSNLKIKRVDFLSVPFDLISFEQCLTYIREADQDKFQYIVTPNVDHIVRLNDDPKHYDIYNSAMLSLCDSRIARILALFCIVRIPQVIPGSDLTKTMFEQIIKPEDELTIIGGTSEPIEKLKDKFYLKKIHHYNPPMGFIDSDREVDSCILFIKNHPSRYIFLAVGSPQQEILANKIYRTEGIQGLGFCIGASLNFLSGEEKRAPRIFQVFALEWFYRLLQNPKRLWKRYLVQDMKIVPIFLRHFYKTILKL